MAKAKVLFLASNPLEQSRLALDEEIRVISSTIRSADHRDALELISAWAVRADDLQQLLLQHRPNVVHFSGHGSRDATTSVIAPSTVASGRDMTTRPNGQIDQLVLMGEDGQAHPMTKAAVVDLFYVLRDNVQLVLFNACHSKWIAEAVAEVIPCTIGMSGAITDHAAIAFAASFYRGLGFGRNIQEAFDLGKNALMNLQTPEDQTPRLYFLKDAEVSGRVVLVGPAIAQSRSVAAGGDRNRVAMLEKVRTIWITGYLEQSLFHETRILLGLSERTGVVARPMDLLVRRPDQGEHPLPSGTQVEDVYDTMDQALIILGAPGSGKTTLLLELARDLLTRATRDPAHPIPIVFPLSTWTESRKPLSEWLRDELNLRYDVPTKLAQEWVTTDQVIPLLDGLDEVGVEHRAECVEAINTFRKSHGLLPLVITSRTADYEALAKPLRLHGALLVRPLTREQVIAYLADLGPAGESVAIALHEDPSLWELLDSPLLLNVVTVAYTGEAAAPSTWVVTMEERRDQLFGSYVNQVLRRRAIERRYTPRQTVQWLSWLASQMASHGQTVFYLERLQLDWLPLKQQRAVRVRKRLVVALIGVLLGGPLIVLAAPAFGLVGLVVGVFVVRRFSGVVKSQKNDIICTDIVGWSWSRIRRSEPSILGFAVVGGLMGLLALGAVGGVVGGAIFMMAEGLRTGLSFGEIDTRAVPNEGIRRSARNALVLGLASWLLTALGGGIAFGLIGSIFGNLVLGLALGLVLGLIFGLAIGLRAGGTACVKHATLRLRLIRNNSTPWNYVKFLDYAAQRILLRKVGGGYVFLHRMLLEHFAARYIESGVGDKAALKPRKIECDM